MSNKKTVGIKYLLNVIVLAITLVLVAFFVFIYSKSNNKPPASIANSPEKLCIDNLTSKSKPPTFEQYPISEIYTGEPATLDQNSSFIAKRFRSYFIEALKGGSNFAGHYAVGQWGFTGIGREMGIVDKKTGKVYVLPYVAEIEFRYNKDSNLLIIDPIEAICSSMDDVAGMGMTGSGKALSEVHPYYFLWQNGTFKLLNPQDGQPSIDENGWLTP